MSEPLDRKGLTITGRHRAVTGPHIQVENDVMVIVTQAFGPRGDNLVGISDVTFDGHPAVTIGVRAGGREGLVHVSPIHGDARKKGFVDIAAGTRCELYCPISGAPLDLVGEAPWPCAAPETATPTVKTNERTKCFMAHFLTKRAPYHEPSPIRARAPTR